MWDNKYEPPKSIFDEIEPVACTVFLIALFAIIPFTPLSPFADREQSSLDQLAGVNMRATEARIIDQRYLASRMKQVDAQVDVRMGVNVGRPVIR